MLGIFGIVSNSLGLKINVTDKEKRKQNNVVTSYSTDDCRTKQKVI